MALGKMDYDFRPITFEGKIFSPSVMGISALEPILDCFDEQSGDWIWRFPKCCGVTKSAESSECHKYATLFLDALLNHKAKVIKGIEDRFLDCSFTPEEVYLEWVEAMSHISVFTKNNEGICNWTAPSHPNELDMVEHLSRIKSFLDHTDSDKI